MLLLLLGDLTGVQARKSMDNNVWGADWRSAFTAMYLSQTDTTASDLGDPDFTPFDNSIFCSLFKCVKKESFILNAQKPTHKLSFTSKKQWVYDQALYPSLNYLAIGGKTHALVVMVHGQLGLCNGATNGANRGIAMYAPSPNVGYFARRSFTYLPTEYLQHETYVLDATSKPSGADAVVVANVATEVADAN